MSNEKVNLLPLLFIPLGFAGIIFFFVLSKGSSGDISTEFVVGAVSIIVVAVVALACLIAAIIYMHPRQDW